MVGVLYQALWEPVFTLSGGEHLNSVQRSWCSLLAWQEVVILFPCAWLLSCECYCITKYMFFLFINSLLTQLKHIYLNHSLRWYDVTFLEVLKEIILWGLSWNKKDKAKQKARRENAA